MNRHIEGTRAIDVAAPQVRIGAAYDGSNVIFRALRACGWGPLLNLGYHPFGRPFTGLNYILTPGTLTPYHRLAAAQMRLVKQSVRLLGVSATDRARVLRRRGDAWADTGKCAEMAR